MVIAIDGPGGVGKSTVTRAVALALGLPYLDTGATYRAVTLAVLEAGVDPEDEEAVLGIAEGVEVGYDAGTVLSNGRDVTAAVREPAVTAAVSAVSAVPPVRSLVVAMQRRWVNSQGGAAVVEGRDIGTVVYPDAAVKVFLTARPDVRALRRAGDAEMAGHDVRAIEQDLARRDHHDSTRAVSPLEAATDAVVIDTSDLTIDGVVERICALVEATHTSPAGE